MECIFCTQTMSCTLPQWLQECMVCNIMLHSTAFSRLTTVFLTWLFSLWITIWGAKEKIISAIGWSTPHSTRYNLSSDIFFVSLNFVRGSILLIKIARYIFYIRNNFPIAVVMSNQRYIVILLWTGIKFCQIKLFKLVIATCTCISKLPKLQFVYLVSCLLGFGSTNTTRIW